MTTVSSKSSYVIIALNRLNVCSDRIYDGVQI